MGAVTSAVPIIQRSLRIVDKLPSGTVGTKVFFYLFIEEVHQMQQTTKTLSFFHFVQMAKKYLQFLLENVPTALV